MAPLARALREGDLCYAAATHALVDTLVTFRQRHAARQHEAHMEGSGADLGAAIPKLYFPLHGSFGLAMLDPGWLKLEEPDARGFTGFLCSALVTPDRVPEAFTQEGYRVTTTRPKSVTTTRQHKITRGPIVCFESAPDEADAYHSAIMLTPQHGAFPPNTLYRLVKVEDSFEAPSDSERPSKRVLQRLFTVRATYRATAPGHGASGFSGTKICGSVITLEYKNREAYIKGLDDLLQHPALTVRGQAHNMPPQDVCARYLPACVSS